MLFSNLAARDLDGAVARLMTIRDAPFDIEGHNVLVGVTISKPSCVTASRTGNSGCCTNPSSVARVAASPVPKHPCVGNTQSAVCLPPGAFLLIAEESGLIIPIGSWVLAEAARQFVDWRSRLPGDRLPTMSVNASAQQLTSMDFCDEVRAVLASTQMSPRQLCIEATETALIPDPLDAQRTLRGIADLGVRIALDDFGTGYSPITYLQQFPVDIIKIDRAFISNPDPSPSDIALVDGLIGLAAALGKTVTAEGVEEVSQLERIRAAQYYQGYFFSKPVDAETFETLLANNAE